MRIKPDLGNPLERKAHILRKQAMQSRISSIGILYIDVFFRCQIEKMVRSISNMKDPSDFCLISLVEELKLKMGIGSLLIYRQTAPIPQVAQTVFHY